MLDPVAYHRTAVLVFCLSNTTRLNILIQLWRARFGIDKGCARMSFVLCEPVGPSEGEI